MRYELSSREVLLFEMMHCDGCELNGKSEVQGLWPCGNDDCIMDQMEREDDNGSNR